MLALVEINAWHWAGFILAVLFFLALDLGVFHKQSHVVHFREALVWTTIWFVVAMMFAAALVPMRGREEATEFLTGYIIELSLSMDNVFVIALIFAYFRVPQEYQHRVLFWGIIGALLMRGIMIGVGAAAIARFHWVLYLLSLFVFYGSYKMMRSGDEGVDPEKSWIIRLARKFFPVTTEFEGHRFTTQLNGRTALTPLALVLLMVETTDMIFALDSVPAIFAVTEKSFIVFTSNVFAILGLRSLYFVLVSAIGFFRYLKTGLSVVLFFVGIKMIWPLFRSWIPGLEPYRISTEFSLLVVVGIILLSVVASIVVAKFSGKADK